MFFFGGIGCVLGQAPIIPKGIFWDRFIISISLLYGKKDKLLLKNIKIDIS